MAYSPYNQTVRCPITDLEGYRQSIIGTRWKYENGEDDKYTVDSVLDDAEALLEYSDFLRGKIAVQKQECRNLLNNNEALRKEKEVVKNENEVLKKENKALKKEVEALMEDNKVTKKKKKDGETEVEVVAEQLKPNDDGTTIQAEISKPGAANPRKRKA